jgi:hypothetical protein
MYWATQKAANAAQEAAQAASDNANMAAYALTESEIASEATLQQMAAQSEAQEVTARAARDANKTTREALVSVQRAFIAQTGVMSYLPVIRDKKVTDLTLQLPWFNAGTTPIKKGRSQINWHGFPGWGLPNNFDFPDEGRVQPRQFVIPPKGLGTATMDLPITWLGYFKSGSLRFFVWGWITYHDIFEGTPVRLSEFCYEVKDVKTSSEDITSPSTSTTWQIELCDEHNCFDEECRDYKQRTEGK